MPTTTQHALHSPRPGPRWGPCLGPFQGLCLSLLLVAGGSPLEAQNPVSKPAPGKVAEIQAHKQQGVKPETPKSGTKPPQTQKQPPREATGQSKPKTQSKPSKKKLSAEQKKELIKILEAGGVTIDFAKARVSVEARVEARSDYIEYLLVGPRGKKHEGMLVTPVKASLIHAAMLALGYKKGVNARAVPKDPFPTEEEYKKGADTHDRFPPKGQEVFLTVQWKDEKSGKTVSYRVQDLYHDVSHGGTVKNARFVYIGSRMARLYKGEEPQYMADVEQNLISNYYVMPDNQLITVVHEHAWDDSIWFPAMDRLPPKGHLVTFIFSRKPIAKPNPLAEPEGKPSKAPPGGATPQKGPQKEDKKEDKKGDKEGDKKGASQSPQRSDR